MDKKIAIFSGSECHNEQKKQYFLDMAFHTGKILAEEGFTVITGAGPGLMDEVMRGAHEAGGHTIGIGLNIENRVQSSYVTDFSAYDKLSPRQNQLIEMADAYIALPGGVGTMYEIFNILALKRVAEMPEKKPLVLIDGYYNIMGELAGEMIKQGFIDNAIYSYYLAVQTPQEAVHFIKEQLIQRVPQN